MESFMIDDVVDALAVPLQQAKVVDKFPDDEFPAMIVESPQGLALVVGQPERVKEHTRFLRLLLEYMNQHPEQC